VVTDAIETVEVAAQHLAAQIGRSAHLLVENTIAK
jgi:hypothetical protein